MDIEIITPFNLVAGYGALNITLMLYLLAQLGGLNTQYAERRINLRQWKRYKKDIGMMVFFLWLIVTIMMLVIYFSFIVE